jgi:two-component system nitrogen regulation response regulator GlnG
MDRKILVIDDDESVSWVIRKALEPSGYEIETRNTIKSGLEVAEKYRLILLDLILPDGNGIDAIMDIRVFNPDALIVIITAHGRMESVINAMKEGAYDYIEKPFDIEELKIVVDRAFRDIAVREELKNLRQSKEEKSSHQIIGRSKAMMKVFKEIGRVASKEVTVLITGESGTGKELVARAIHNNSKRKLGPFAAINSASIPRDLLESELFGWEKGAFTGASEKKAGKIQAADTGTLFLDEISEMNIDLQAKLLRFIQDKEYSPIGSNKTVKADVRIIGATNKDLLSCVQKGSFREDLYYRFNVIEIKLPPLRERKEDIPLLAGNFLKESIRTFGLPPKSFSKDAEKALIEYDWPGNVRELENTIKKASILSKGSLIERRDLFGNDYDSFSVKELLAGKLNGMLNKMMLVEKSNLYDILLAEFEKALFGVVLDQTKGNQLKAAKMLGINRNTLNKKLKQYKLI